MWPMEALTVYPRPKKRPTVLALAGDSTMTSFPERLREASRPFAAPRPFFGLRVAFSGRGKPAWASVSPIRYRFVPHTEHLPLVAGVPLAVKTAAASSISRLV